MGSGQHVHRVQLRKTGALEDLAVMTDIHPSPGPGAAQSGGRDGYPAGLIQGEPFHFPVLEYPETADANTPLHPVADGS